MRYTTIFFDLDDTLYTSDNGLWDAIGARMNRYMVERVGLPEGEVPLLRRHYFETYGTTLRGLQRHHKVDSDDYLAFVHDLRLRDYLQPEPEFRHLLLSLPQRCWIFTNADSEHAKRVLTILGLGECFNGIIDVKAMDFACKPEAEAYQRALNLAGSPAPEECVLIDDSLLNLKAARDLGMMTILVRSDANEHPAATYTIPNLAVLRRTVPILWEGY
ncbi:MAG: pyrimidine 5'-nucleotidase [Anaerolineales bacterium]